MRVAIAFGVEELGSIASAENVPERELQIMLNVGISVLVYRDSRGRVRAVHRAEPFAHVAIADVLLYLRRDVVKSKFASAQVMRLHESSFRVAFIARYAALWFLAV
jgi:hypothetical protein